MEAIVYNRQAWVHYAGNLFSIATSVPLLFSITPDTELNRRRRFICLVPYVVCSLLEVVTTEFIIFGQQQQQSGGSLGITFNKITAGWDGSGHVQSSMIRGASNYAMKSSVERHSTTTPLLDITTTTTTTTAAITSNNGDNNHLQQRQKITFRLRNLTASRVSVATLKKRFHSQKIKSHQLIRRSLMSGNNIIIRNIDGNDFLNDSSTKQQKPNFPEDVGGDGDGVPALSRARISCFVAYQLWIVVRAVFLVLVCRYMHFLQSIQSVRRHPQTKRLNTTRRGVINITVNGQADL